MGAKTRRMPDGSRELQLTCEPWTDALLQRYLADGCTGVLVGCPRPDGTAPDLQFLTTLPDLRSVRLLVGVGDYSALAGLTQLRNLQFHASAQRPVDLRRCTGLRRLEAPYQVVADGLPAVATLHDLTISDWPSGDFTALGGKPELDSLRADLRQRAKVASAGLSGAPALRRLVLNSGRLLDTADLATLHNLVELSADNTRLPDLDFVASMPSLRELVVYNGGDVPSLAGLVEHPALTTVILTGSTTVLDGDLSALWRMPNLRKVALTHRPHYTRTAQDVQAAFATP